MKVRYTVSETLLSLCWVLCCVINYFTFSFIPELFIVIGFLHFIDFLFCIFGTKFEVRNGEVKFKKLNFRYGFVKLVPVKSIVKIEQGVRQIGGVWKMISVPTFFFYLENGKKYEVFPATDKESEIRKYTNIIAENFDLVVVKTT